MLLGAPGCKQALRKGDPSGTDSWVTDYGPQEVGTLKPPAPERGVIWKPSVQVLLVSAFNKQDNDGQGLKNSSML